MPFLSVIIPTLNEAENLATTLDCFQSDGVEEVIVVDGGSSDSTVEMASRKDIRVLKSPEPGRAKQLNLGARESSGEVLLFTHADTLVSRASLSAMEEALRRDPTLRGGGFARRFDSPSCLLKFTAWCSDFRGRRWGLFLGDQGIFVRRADFEALGGFDETVQPGEDLDFSYRLSRRGRTALISPPVLSSARRFVKRGAFRQTMQDFVVAREILAASKRRSHS